VLSAFLATALLAAELIQCINGHVVVASTDPAKTLTVLPSAGVHSFATCSPLVMGIGGVWEFLLMGLLCQCLHIIVCVGPPIQSNRKLFKNFNSDEDDVAARRPAASVQQVLSAIPSLPFQGITG
jgi:hypothetical protein